MSSPIAPRFARALLICAGLFGVVLLALALLWWLRADSMPLLLAVLGLLVLLTAVLVFGFAVVHARFSPPTLARHALPLGALDAAIALFLAYMLGVAGIDQALAAKDHGAAYDDCHKVWATRGLVAPGLTKVAAAGNTAATINDAFAHGAPGVEVDVYFDAELADFVVSHDFPYEKKVDGGLSMLDKLLTQTDASKHYWLDFKRHSHLTRAEAEAAATRLVAIAGVTGIPRERLWVEGTEPFNLMPFQRAGFSIIFDVHPPADDHLLTPFVTELHKAVYLWGGFTVMGMNYGTEAEPIYGTVARRHLGDIPVFLYHVPTDRALLAQVARLPQVRVLMAGDHSAMVYDINACGVDGAERRVDRAASPR